MFPKCYHWFPGTLAPSVSVLMDQLDRRRSEALPHVTNCPNNLHKKLPTYAEAIIWMQVALIKGVLELVPR